MRTCIGGESLATIEDFFFTLLLDLRLFLRFASSPYDVGNSDK